MEMISMANQAGVAWIGIEIDAGQGTKVLDRQRVKDCSPISTRELVEIKSQINKPFVLKGVLSQWDAAKALEVGADVIVVSNHGAHTVDYLPHPLEVMEEITSTIQGKIPIIVDGGFRRGTDVLKGLAIGAQAIGLGRPILYGLAADGENGVVTVITEIAQELKRVMTMTGIQSCDQIHKGILRIVK
jgi:(S)-2-hydroxy-acid oxidase